MGQSELLFQGDGLEVRRGRQTRAIPTSELTAFQVTRRPLFEALAAGFGFAGLAALVHSRDLRLLLLLLDLVMLAAAFAYSRYRFVASLRGNDSVVASMVVRRRSAEERELQEGFRSVRAFLTLRGIKEGR